MQCFGIAHRPLSHMVTLEVDLMVADVFSTDILNRYGWITAEKKSKGVSVTSVTTVNLRNEMSNIFHLF